MCFWSLILSRQPLQCPAFVANVLFIALSMTEQNHLHRRYCSNSWNHSHSTTRCYQHKLRLIYTWAFLKYNPERRRRKRNHLFSSENTNIIHKLNMLQGTITILFTLAFVSSTFRPICFWDFIKSNPGLRLHHVWNTGKP